MKHSLVKQTIVDTASELFYQNGYNLTGINEIIAEAGVAKATLYNHFKSKEDICVAYLKHKNVSFLESIKAFADQSGEGKEKLLGLFDFLSQFFSGKDFNGCWCINTISELPKDNVEIREEIQQQKQGLIKWIETLTNEAFPGKKEKENARLARQIYLLYEGAVSESYLHQDAWPIMEAKKICNALLY